MSLNIQNTGFNTEIRIDLKEIASLTSNNKLENVMENFLEREKIKLKMNTKPIKIVPNYKIIAKDRNEFDKLLNFVNDLPLDLQRAVITIEKEFSGYITVKCKCFDNGRTIVLPPTLETITIIDGKVRADSAGSQFFYQPNGTDVNMITTKKS